MSGCKTGNYGLKASQFFVAYLSNLTNNCLLEPLNNINPLHSPVQSYWAWRSLCILGIVFPADGLSSHWASTAGHAVLSLLTDFKTDLLSLQLGIIL